VLNSLNDQLNPIFHLLALLGAHHIFHVSGLRVKLISIMKCMWAWIYISSNSSVRHQMELSGQLHTPDCYSFATRSGCGVREKEKCPLYWELNPYFLDSQPVA